MDNTVLTKLTAYLAANYDPNGTEVFPEALLKGAGISTGSSDKGSLIGMAGGLLLGGLFKGPGSTLGRPKAINGASVDIDVLRSFMKENIGLSFSEMLLKYIDEKGFEDTEVYKAANCDRQQFSKVRCNKDYHVSKMIAQAYCLALKLTLAEAQQLLAAAGYGLSAGDKHDLVFQFCLINRIYSLAEANEMCLNIDGKPLYQPKSSR